MSLFTPTYSLDPSAHRGEIRDGAGRPDRNELGGAAAERSDAAPSEEGDAVPDRVGAAMELQRRVMADDCIVRCLGRDEVGIELEGVSFRSGWHDSVQSTSNAHDPAPRSMLAQQTVHGARAAAVPTACELPVGEHGMGGEEILRGHVAGSL